jgi:hypothetical protein
VSKRIAKLERQLARLTAQRPVRPKHMSRRKKTVLLALMWLTPGLPPPGPFG